ncbi:MAG: glycosyltransferase, partial [Actinomycetota bacterium]
SDLHNMTPKDILGRWDTGVAMVIGQGIKQLAVLKDRIIGAISVSQYNKWCLKQEGITENSFVAAPFIPLSRSVNSDFEDRRDRGNRPVSRWLFVGRIAPNKAQHDIIKAFSAYRVGWDSDATLTLVGSVSSLKYARCLDELIRDMGIAENVYVAGPVGDEELEHYYREATVFVCLSDHEGFGFPVIEALSHSLPVVAFASTAIPETLGTSGILLSSKDPLEIAAAVSLVESDHELRNELLEKSRQTLARYSFDVAKQENLFALQSLIPEMAAHL